MTNQPPSPDALPPIDPAWGLPSVPYRGEPVSAGHFAVLLHAARTMKTVGKLSELEPIFAGGETYTEIGTDGKARERSTRRKTYQRWLSEHPALAELLESAINLRRVEVLSRLECQALRIALSDGDTTTDYDKSGAVKRVRKDMRNASYMTLQLLKSLDKDRFGDSKRLEVSGGLTHDHQHKHAHLVGNVGNVDAGGYRIDLQSVREALTEDEARQMLDFLERIEEARLIRDTAQRQSPALPPGQNGSNQ